ncbi:hypothetical protein CDG77_16765 [Nostoc sp. 'Peltigera membranacea cyanobiont' 213]|uniref:hypothetical protein n=1 Tax=unclassified Nostoc TaxID=2593658 RepID=UPI000B9505A4|nr:MULTISPECIES: hypothetical protein [unclassified Nostoc]OYD90760.1 hypothetical protein CDG77_16765 [Nostoc sp. 'Peltigera membranacea cyanobiont' 213]
MRIGAWGIGYSLRPQSPVPEPEIILTIIFTSTDKSSGYLIVFLVLSHLTIRTMVNEKLKFRGKSFSNYWGYSHSTLV